MRLTDKLRLGLIYSRNLGHTVTHWVDDGDKGERVAQCEACDRFMAVDTESPEPWGFLVRSVCPRKRMA